MINFTANKQVFIDDDLRKRACDATRESLNEDMRISTLFASGHKDTALSLFPFNAVEEVKKTYPQLKQTKILKQNKRR